MNGLLYINLKCDPQESEFLRKAYRDITPAYHMNKTHWNSVITGGDVPVKEIKRMIESSYNLVKPKRTKINKTGRNN
jgi:predicted DNA-binding protein (MmcQ/YjbR family)